MFKISHIDESGFKEQGAVTDAFFTKPATPEKEAEMSNTSSSMLFGRALMFLVIAIELLNIGLRLQYSYLVLPKTTSNEIIRIDTLYGTMEKFDHKKKTWEPYTNQE